MHTYIHSYTHTYAYKVWRYCRRQTANALQETKSNEFKSTVLMLKMMETKILSMELKILSAINGLASTDANGSKDPNGSHEASASAGDRHPPGTPPVSGQRKLVPPEQPLGINGEVAGELARVSSGIADVHAGMQQLRDRQDGLEETLAEHQRHVTAQLEALLRAVTVRTHTNTHKNNQTQTHTHTHTHKLPFACELT